jgi:hypothetical protein
MNKRLIGVTVVALLTVVCCAGIFAATVGFLPKVATIEKYDKLENGMWYKEVAEILGSPGVETKRVQAPGKTNRNGDIWFGSEFKNVAWKNWTGSGIECKFENDFLVEKSQIGLR